MRARSASAFLALVRWQNALIAAGGVLFGAWWVGWGSGRARAIALATLAALPLTAVANAWNDLADAEIDRLAHPERPIPAGHIGRPAALRVVAGSIVAALALSAMASAALGALSAVVVALMLAYSPWLKRAGLPGNATVAVLASLPFLYGAWAAGAPRAALPLLAIAAPLHFAREIAKDLEDAPADALARRTLPVAAGGAAAGAALVGASIVFLGLLAPYVAARPRLGAAAAPALLLLGYAVLAALRRRRGSPRAFKLAMVGMMVAFVLAR